MNRKLITPFAIANIAVAGLLASETDTPLSSAAVVSEQPAPVSAKELTTARCLICHGNPQAGQQRLAPPFMMVKRHYESMGKEEFVKTISSWVRQPAADKSRMPGAIRHFGLMPTLPYPEAEVKAIAEYIHRTDFPMSGGGGMGVAQAQGCGDGKACGKKSCCKGCNPAADAEVASETSAGKEKACGSCESDKRAAQGKGSGKGRGKGHGAPGCGDGKACGKKSCGKGCNPAAGAEAASKTKAGKEKACGSCGSDKRAAQGKGSGKGRGKGHGAQGRGRGRGHGHGHGRGRDAGST